MNILVTGAWSDAQTYIDEFEAHGHHVLFMQQEKEELPCDPSWIEGVICNGLFLHHDIHMFANLRYIQLTSAGFDRVPMDAVKAGNIEIHNARGVYSVPMAEHAVMGILELYRKSDTCMRYQKEHIWKKERSLHEINGKEILIIGCGSVGTECARRLKAFNAYVRGIDLYLSASDVFDEVLPVESLDELLRTADIVILTVPLSEQTYHLIDEQRLAEMKSDAILVNISRGKVVDQAALIHVLNDRKIGGAFLDVFEDEPLAEDSPLWNCENTLLTPHISFIGDGNNERLWYCISVNLFKDDRYV